MASQQLLLSVVIALLAVEYSSARCNQGYFRGERDGVTVTDPKCLQGLEGKSVDIQGKNKLDYYIRNKNEGSKGFVEAAADEVAKLMGKDYKGADRPRRKPPINNHEPNN